MSAEQWWSLSKMRATLSEGKLLGYWSGPACPASCASFLAVSLDQGFRSVVVLEGSSTISFDGRAVKAAEGTRVHSLDLEGLTIRNWVVLFYKEPKLARSTLSFETATGKESLRFVVTGLAPGTWEIWRAGWLVDSEATVNESEAVLYFEGLPGSYFLRRLN